MSDVKILNTFWFQGGGIVRVEDPYEGIKYYIRGIEVPVTEDFDAQHVADWGSTFPKAAGDALFGFDEVKNGTAVPIPTNKAQAQLMVALGMNFLEGK